ncbi:hypothetical protein [Okeania sp. KiyG1]|uniref:hypothetical protein n=1 Tax=Okeania sp. KiyG1 TaxID=2720165 RepID=UPI0019B22DED|nr:hypothetical protein [Okeania sp. KiyG1]GGA38238.1 hypothetical protein CYANOKiyG1_56390 [Okeania sp. KiyG1]
MLNYIWQKGWQLWFYPEMELDHLIPKSRFEKEYLVKFFRQNGLCRYYFRMLNYQPWQQVVMSFAYMISDLRKAIVFYLKNRNNLKTDVILIGEMELLLSLFMSPFSFGKKLTIF